MTANISCVIGCITVGKNGERISGVEVQAPLGQRRYNR